MLDRLLITTRYASRWQRSRSAQNSRPTRSFTTFRAPCGQPGCVRAVGAMDTLIAAYAILNDAILLHYDREFEFVARVRTDFRHVWVAPRGSL